MRHRFAVSVLLGLCLSAVTPSVAGAETEDLFNQTFHASAVYTAPPGTPEDPAIVLVLDWWLNANVSDTGKHSASTRSTASVHVEGISCGNVRISTEASADLLGQYPIAGTVYPLWNISSNDDTSASGGCAIPVADAWTSTGAGVAYANWETTNDAQGLGIQWKDSSGVWHTYVVPNQSVHGMCKAHTNAFTGVSGYCKYIPPSPV